jgi:mannose-6-phosphate isomerase-like protein (cupin superfamily)
MTIEPLDPLKENEARATYKCGPVYFIKARAGGVLADHTHDEAETLWIIDGKGSVLVGEKTTEFKGPCIIKIPGGVYHKFMPETDVNFVEQIHGAGTE